MITTSPRAVAVAVRRDGADDTQRARGAVTATMVISRQPWDWRNKVAADQLARQIDVMSTGAVREKPVVVPELREEAERWLKENLRGILQMRIEEEI